MPEVRVRTQLIAWLYNYGGDVWTPFLDKLEKSAKLP